ncbi:amylo-alpha-1,6-glucosidase [Humibacter sp.]|uniref:amylo-alpha-1,6-glucosidase n=1 Tax=Humibacter sp. TaxID=1940291 RepID=UPI003F7D7AF9
MSECLGITKFPDLRQAPFTLPRARLLVFADARDAETPEALTVRVAEYERSLDDCIVIERLRVLDERERPLPITSVRPERIEFGGRVDLTFASEGALSVGSDGGGTWSLELRMPPGALEEVSGWSLPLPSAPRTRFAGARVLRRDGGLIELGETGGGGIVLNTLDGPGPAPDHGAHLAATASIWAEWFARCPVVREDLQDMVRDCWWVLGANIVELPGQGHARAVVPSKIGYVGLWQWDAYFIAAGLRHGDLELAREQLDLALRFPTELGQLPDVVHDDGVLASSDDLPPGDRENLRRHASAAADPTAPVPLTKPPLTAWAIAKLAESGVDADWVRRSYEVAARSQEWWFRHQDSDSDGLPEYSHPYSSGLDDSPVFDAALPVASPDLTAYLIVQDDLLAQHFDKQGDPDRADQHRCRSARTLELLIESWDGERGFFPAVGGGKRLDSYTAVSLLPLLTGRLPEPIRDRIVGTLDDPEKFSTPFVVPTVAADDPDFSTERMWRGPVWININALIVEGLRASGEPSKAREVAERTVRLVIDGGGPHEYFNPETGQKARTATTAFGWSAALFIDLAVGLSA